MAQLGFYVDATKCTGCRTCQIACKDKNRLDTGTWFRQVKCYSLGEYPNVKGYNLSLSCNHCEKPACVAVCPTGALYKTEEGPVLYDNELCIGCEKCSICPYGQPKLIPELGVVRKCDTCYAIRMAGGNPACVDACPQRALDFGDLDELKAKYGNDLADEVPAIGVSAELTHPHVLIKTKPCMAEDGAEELWL